MNWLRGIAEYDRRQRERWRAVSNRSVVLFMASAFFLLAAVGALTDLTLRTPPPWSMWLLPVMCGGFAAAITWSGVRANLSWTTALTVTFAAALLWVSFRVPHGRALPIETERWLKAVSIMTVLLITFGWGLAGIFINREGQRLFRVQTEMRLAGEIHQALVPTIDRRIGDFEFYGVSLPSGMVGGDLVDVLTREGRWLAYVADVSGHGVNAGVLMAMIKSAINTTLRFQPRVDGLLEEVNRVLCSLKTSHMFATCGLIAFAPGMGMRYALAGHLPILRLRDQEIEMLSERNLPLGIFPDIQFQATPCEVKKGDVLVIVTDGLTDAPGEDGEDLGLRGISQTLRDNRNLSVKELATQILNSANRRGVRSDDQSVLVVRCLA